MIIGSIKEGVVIDHIPAGQGMRLYHYLHLEELDSQIAIIKNAVSAKRGRKDILKISGKIDLNYDLLGYIDPNITVNIIEEGETVQKVHPQLPETISGIIRCKNPRCITSIEQDLPHVFKLTDREHGVYRCIYCETKAAQ
ncbi:MAG: aspartate carbamoyltransferase regulatory subunit [Ndongobacter sp.]|nr:aspartate carbamoyltransferase regulatory subunit [Ndongobacter sp.]